MTTTTVKMMMMMLMMILASSCGADVMIFQRTDNSKKFDRNWQDFKQGFGGPTEDKYWIGNDRIHQLTTSEGYTKLRIEMTTQLLNQNVCTFSVY